jgi:acyl-CoA dehydrogenase
MDAFDSDERRALAALVRTFTETEIAPALRGWETAGDLPRSLHRQAGDLGLLGLSYPEDVGGSGGDLLDVVVMTEEVLAGGGSGGLIAGLFTHGISIPHVVDAAARRRESASEADSASADILIDRVIRPTLTGRAITCLAVTEPDGGSDVGGLRTTAVPVDPSGVSTSADEATHWRLNGSKAYITSGARADFAVVAARAFGPGAAGIALFLVPTDSPGFAVTARMTKMGWHCSDTAELAFTDLVVPDWALLTPGPGAGFASLARHFAVERISLAVTAYATAARCLTLTLDWARQRVTFGRPLISRQVVRHDLVEMYRQTEVARSYTRSVAARVAAGEDALLAAAMAKNTAVAACDWVVDKAVQLHGGYGFLRDAEVEMHYRDARVLGIGGGATEVMTDLAAKLLGY